VVLETKTGGSGDLFPGYAIFSGANSNRRHAELVSASNVQQPTASVAEHWTLKRVQGDGIFAEAQLFDQPTATFTPSA